MPRISPFVEKWENRLSSKFRKHQKKLRGVWPLLVAGLYLYGVLVNSIRLGIQTTFGDAPPETVWEWNPVLALTSIFTPTGIGVTLFLALMICLITKKGYNWFSGYKFTRDPRGFDILPDATHGGSGWMNEKQMDAVLLRGKAGELTGTILGKISEEGDPDNKYSEYFCPKQLHDLNDHMLIWGATGSGKSRGVIKPFLIKAAQRGESIVLVDSKAELYEATAQYFRERGYLVRAYNLLDLENSDGFNCISDIEQDPGLVRTVAEIIIANTSNAKDRQNFWETAEKNLLTSMLHYMGTATDANGKPLPIEQRSLGAVYRMLASERFNKIAEKIDALPPGHPARAPFDLIRETPVQNRANIVMGLGNRLGVFQNKLVDSITKYSDIDLTMPGQRPCVYYCIISDQDPSLEFLSSMFFSLLFFRLASYARRYGKDGRLPVKVNVCLEEFSNIGYLGESFLRVLNVIRSRNVACQIVVQGAAPLSGRYPKKEWEEIVGACDWQLFLGCNDQMTAEYISRRCGTVTVRIDSNQMPQQPLFSPVYNSTRPYSITRSATQRLLMMPDEIMQMDNKECLVLIRGRRPLRLQKIIVEELPEYALLKPCRVTEYVPAWREAEEKAGHKRRERIKKAKEKAGTGETREDEGQQTLYGAADDGDTGDTPDSASADMEKEGSAKEAVPSKGETSRDTELPFLPGDVPGEMDLDAFNQWLIGQHQVPGADGRRRDI
jgi:type IV secretion system protein VirD4